MRYNWSRYLRLILAGITGTTLIGWYFGVPLYGLLTGLTLYLWWTLLQARRLYQWLGNPSASDEPPQSIGMWGHIFDSLHKLHQGHLSKQDTLRSRINRVQDSTNSMREGVIMTNTKGEMEWWNDAAEYLLGFRRSTDRGQYIQNLIRSPAFKTYFEARNYAEPLELNSPAKPHIHLEFQINQFGDDDRLIVAKDVTRLFQLEQMRRDFIGNVSHEMRTPLTVISRYLGTL
ncbi:MAG: phosphate regulon sensor protein PhoR, partial [Marinobacter sp.]|uniref:phosphate regulon sensor histidine kinase PhoR n=1 Tax=Marinobacter sp. TaxID=50741 RepID=UPI003299DE34